MADAIQSISQIFTILIALASILIGLISKFKRDVFDKVKKEIGKEKLYDALVIIVNLMSRYSVDDLKKLLVDFSKKSEMEETMKVEVINIKKALSLRESVIHSKLQQMVSEYETRKQTSLIKNKKRWHQLRNSKHIDEALDSVLQIYRENVKLQRMALKKKAKIDQIDNLIKSIYENIPINRERRLKLEEIKENARREEDLNNLDEIKLKLWKVFADQQT